MADQFALPLPEAPVKETGRRRLPALKIAPTRPIFAEEPEAGFYKMKLARGAVETPARIYWADHEPGEPSNPRDRWPPLILVGEIGGKPADAFDVWHWQRGRITEAEFNYQMADLEHARAWRPGDPKTEPRKAINLSTAPPLYQRKAE